MQSRILLLGDPNARPAGLERVLIRAGYVLSEAESLPAAPGDAGSPDLTVLTIGSCAGEWDRDLLPITDTAWRLVPAIVLLPERSRDGVSRALALGAVDAMVAPIQFEELATRIAVRLRATRDGFRATSSSRGQAQLFAEFEHVALAARPEEMLQVLVRGLGRSLGAAHAAFLLPLDAGRARLVAVAERPEVRSQEIELARYPEVGHATRTGRTVYIPSIAHHPLFEGYADVPNAPAPGGSAVAVPVTFQGRSLGFIVLRTGGTDAPLSADDVAFVETLVASTCRLLDHEERRATLYRRQASAGVIDPLTGCGGLDALERRLREEKHRFDRYGRQFSVVLLDVKALRHVNQRLGIEAGDRVLAELGLLLQRELRAPDFVARYGGDEFALVLPETDEHGAYETVRRIRAVVVEHRFADELESPLELTAGVAALPREGVFQTNDLLAAAERAVGRPASEPAIDGAAREHAA